jgi:hypothetical protein
MYKLFTPIDRTEPCYVVLVKTNMFIPFDPANTDYQQYLKWLEEGNTPEPADEVGDA